MMNFKFNKVSLICLHLAFFLGAKTTQANVFERIVQKSGVPKSSLGIIIGGEDVTYEVNSEKMLIFASATKLVTAAAVLQTFPPGTKFETHLLVNGKIEGGTLTGDLILKGGGDPSFVSENMWYLVNEMVRTGVKKVSGGIVIDDSRFDQNYFDESRQEQRVDRAYDAPVGAVSMNWNSVNIYIRPGSVGQTARVYLDPENEYFDLKGSVTTVGAGAKGEVFADRPADTNPKKDIIQVGGKIQSSKEEVVIYKSVRHPGYWVGENLKAFLKQRGIVVDGDVRMGAAPTSAKLVAKSPSKPVEQIVADMNKFSNNYVAEMLIKNVGAETTGGVGTISNGLGVVHKMLDKMNLRSGIEIVNPSGLTRENRAQAKSLWLFLKKIQSDFQLFPEFVQSVPIAGVDGTLKNRLKSSPAKRWIRAKTGLLDGVVALAGFAGKQDGKIIPFVFLFNGSADQTQVRKLFDDLAEAIVLSDR